jgi:prefoldin subunit 5
MKMNSQRPWFSQKKQDTVSPTQIKNHVSDLHTWMRNLEQNVMSVSARLGAVENRLTHFSKMKNQSGKEISGIIENNRSDDIMIDEHTMNQMQGIGNELQHITQSITQLKQQTDAFHEFQEQAREELFTLQQLKKKQPIMMKLGHREIPVEITGIIGGSIAFIISALLFVDATDIVLSPWFIFGIGSVLMGSTFFRTNSGINIIKKIHATLFSQGKNANANHSDSLS